jgi:glycosyltransferase involved in cell wall biosynthesis
MQQLKVLQITQSAGGGVQKYVIQLCQYLNRSLFTITGCCSKESREARNGGDIPFAEAFRQIGIPYVVIPMERAIKPWRDFSCLFAIYKHMKRGTFDLVHTHSSKAGVLARIAARMAGIPVVIYSPHAFSFDGPGNILKKAPYIFFERIAAFFCDAIITDSSTEKDLALKFKIAPNKKIRVIPPSIALKDYSGGISEDDKRTYLKKLRVPEGHKVVTMICRLAVQKDPITFILSCQRLMEDCQDVTFLLVGDGPLREACLGSMQETGMNERIKVLGWRRDYKTILRVSDLLVSSSLWEGMPFIVLEAMAFAKAVVATRSTGTVDVINDGENGFLVPPRSPEMLAQKMKWVLERPDIGSAIGKAARETIKDKFCVEKTIPSMEEFYLQLYHHKQEGSVRGHG